MSIPRSSFPSTFPSILQVDSVLETTADWSKDSVQVPCNDTSHPDGATSTSGDTLPDLEAPEGPATGISAEDSTEEAALLTRGGQEVSSLDSISHEEEDNLLSSTLQEPMVRPPSRGAPRSIRIIIAIRSPYWWHRLPCWTICDD